MASRQARLDRATIALHDAEVALGEAIAADPRAADVAAQIEAARGLYEERAARQAMREARWANAALSAAFARVASAEVEVRLAQREAREETDALERAVDDARAAYTAAIAGGTREERAWAAQRLYVAERDLGEHRADVGDESERAA